MPDAKITELPAATLPLDGTELMEIVQGGVNKKVAKSDVATGGGGTVTSVTGTTNRITSTGGATPVIDIAATYVGQTSITTLGTIATGTVPGTLVANTPAGNLSATNVQAALNELDTEKQTAAQVQTIADAKVADAINNGTTTVAPSQNAVFDALALKANLLTTYRREAASHTLDSTDLATINSGARLVIEMNVGSANTLTIPPNATVAFPVGTKFWVKQYGAGQTSFVPGASVDLRSSAGLLTIGSQYGTAIFEKIATNEWYIENGDPSVLSSTWTPTLTNTTNIAASTAYLCSYSRIGNRVQISGRVDIDPTATGSVVLGISLPIASAFSTANQAGGAAFSPGIAGQGAAILSDATNDRLTLQYVAVDVTNQAFYFSAGYEVI